jgi:hypothetical protein
MFISLFNAYQRISDAISTVDDSDLQHPSNIEEAFSQLNRASIEFRLINRQLRTVSKEFNRIFSFSLGDFDFLSDVLSVSYQITSIYGFEMYGIPSDGKISDNELHFLSILKDDLIYVLDIISLYYGDGMRGVTSNISINEYSTILENFLLRWRGLVRYGLYGTIEENPFVLLLQEID